MSNNSWTPYGGWPVPDNVADTMRRLQPMSIWSSMDHAVFVSAALTDQAIIDRNEEDTTYISDGFYSSATFNHN